MHRKNRENALICTTPKTGMTYLSAYIYIDEEFLINEEIAKWQVLFFLSRTR